MARAIPDEPEVCAVCALHAPYGCAGCPMMGAAQRAGMSCEDYQDRYPIKAVRTAQRWLDEEN